jgi:hypothetical protein
MITNLEGTITFCDHDTLLIYVGWTYSQYIIKAMKVMSVAGAWRWWKETNNWLVYGHRFQTKDLTEYFTLTWRQNARDHIEGGKELFVLSQKGLVYLAMVCLKELHWEI